MLLMIVKDKINDDFIMRTCMLLYLSRIFIVVVIVTKQLYQNLAIYLSIYIHITTKNSATMAK